MAACSWLRIDDIFGIGHFGNTNAIGISGRRDAV